MLKTLYCLLWLLLLQGCQPGQDDTRVTTPTVVQSQPAPHKGEIEVALLPSQARDTLQAIKRGGPFAYPRDGVVFSNYEHRLPKQARGYYHEYTVKTPGAHNRGARRIIAGQPGEYYYSDDHYKSFKRIRE